jgi:hypothetical protein
MAACCRRESQLTVELVVRRSSLFHWRQEVVAVRWAGCTSNDRLAGLGGVVPTTIGRKRGFTPFAWLTAGWKALRGFIESEASISPTSGWVGSLPPANPAVQFIHLSDHRLQIRSKRVEFVNKTLGTKPGCR